jgi:predicted HTH transcriptional regulator
MNKTNRTEYKRELTVKLEKEVIAFIHNDYTTEVPPKFELFDDRIEITSTGGLPNGLSQNEFLKGFPFQEIRS